jgi:hypothetical protein
LKTPPFASYESGVILYLFSSFDVIGITPTDVRNMIEEGGLYAILE